MVLGMSCNVLEIHAVSIFIIEPYGGVRLLRNFCVTCQTIECYIPKTVISVFLLWNPQILQVYRVCLCMISTTRCVIHQKSAGLVFVYGLFNNAATS